MEFPQAILSRLRTSGVVAGFSVERVADAVPIARALLDGGIDAIELTLRTDAGIESVRAICAEFPEMLVGVGTILTPETAKQVHAAGAAFGVAPGTNPRVVRAAQQAGLPFAPGIATPTDLELAIELGCRFVKFFPAEPCGGIEYLRSMSAPYKHLNIEYFPLGGINADNMLLYLQEPNVLAIGGSWIVNKQLVESQAWTGISARAADVIKRVKESVKR
ncbi:bifunctional 4-hydroxy-2-oxoglutarate aldolase/2-dehydro-3-deoxy-phosphogluconate aldolase [Novipirellula caenicola]|uniref:2-dehydro-3-deoxy-phosphogluconate aldolase n=1 Tax=Novipirellula caenicola TaxID=1536901 RepID=A0ABP9W171_9BACT